MDTSKVNYDLLEVAIDDGTKRIMANVSLGTAYPNLTPITSTATGADILAHLVGGRSVVIQLEFRETDEPTRKLLMGYDTDGDALAVGAQLPAYKLAVIDPLAANDSKSILFPKAAFTSMTQGSDGEGERTYVVTAVAERDLANDKEPWLIGDPDTEFGWGA